MLKLIDIPAALNTPLKHLFSRPIIKKRKTDPIWFRYKTRQIEMDNQVKLYPNPTKGDLILESPMTIKTIKVLSHKTGQIIQVLRGSIHVDLTHFPEGIYILEMALKEGSIERSNIIVQR